LDSHTFFEQNITLRENGIFHLCRKESLEEKRTETWKDRIPEMSKQTKDITTDTAIIADQYEEDEESQKAKPETEDTITPKLSMDSHSDSLLEEIDELLDEDQDFTYSSTDELVGGVMWNAL